MKLTLDHLVTAPADTCPFRLLDAHGQEITWVNDFLDAQHIRQLSPRSLRAYAYDLLNFARWFQSQPQSLAAITESTLLEYVRHQLKQRPRPTAPTVNHRLTVVRCLYRFHYGREIPPGHSHFQRKNASARGIPIAYGERGNKFGTRIIRGPGPDILDAKLTLHLSGIFFCFA